MVPIAILGIALLGLLLLIQSQNKIIYGVSQGTYTAVDGDGGFFPSLTLDVRKNRFVFSYDPFSSYLNAGTFSLKKGKLFAETDDGKFTFVFAVIDNDTIQFVQKGSSEIPVRPEGPPVVDGMAFKFSDER